jgi:hypothetical protein
MRTLIITPARFRRRSPTRRSSANAPQRAGENELHATKDAHARR